MTDRDEDRSSRNERAVRAPWLRWSAFEMEKRSMTARFFLTMPENLWARFRPGDEPERT